MFWAQYLCRICATIGTTSYPIFEKASNRNIDVKIKRCLNINIFEDDLKPKVVCEACYGKLNDLIDFIDLCENANSKFDHILYQTAERPVLENSWHPTEVPESIVDQNVNCVVLEPKTPNSEFLTIINYKETNLSYEPPPTSLDSKNLYGEETFEGYQENSTVLRHSSQFLHKIKQVALTNEEHLESYNYSTPEKSVRKEYQPPATPTNLVQTKVKTNESTTKSNKRRQGNLISVDSIISIMKESESLAQKNQVTVGSAATKDDTTKQKKYTCQECQQSFTRKFNLTTHMSRHANKKPHACDKCEKSFVLNSELTLHKKLHNSQHQCRVCDKVFAAPSKLKNHLRIHTNERIFACPEENCDKSFTDKRNLMGHMSSHTKDRNYMCEICNKAFKMKNKLKSHMNVHKNTTDHICTICGTSYKWKPNLLKHIKKHIV